LPNTRHADRYRCLSWTASREFRASAAPHHQAERRTRIPVVMTGDPVQDQSLSARKQAITASAATCGVRAPSRSCAGSLTR